LFKQEGNGQPSVSAVGTQVLAKALLEFVAGFDDFPAGLLSGRPAI
jgi:hypothetical protein